MSSGMWLKRVGIILNQIPYDNNCVRCDDVICLKQGLPWSHLPKRQTYLVKSSEAFEITVIYNLETPKFAIWLQLQTTAKGSRESNFDF